MDEWDLPLKGSRSTVIWQIQKALEQAPGMSMFTPKAIMAIAEIAAGSLPVENNPK